MTYLRVFYLLLARVFHVFPTVIRFLILIVWILSTCFPILIWFLIAEFPIVAISNPIDVTFPIDVLTYSSFFTTNPIYFITFPDFVRRNFTSDIPTTYEAYVTIIPTNITTINDVLITISAIFITFIMSIIGTIVVVIVILMGFWYHLVNGFCFICKCKQYNIIPPLSTNKILNGVSSSIYLEYYCI